MRIIVTGCGRMGSGLASTLDRAGHTVAVIDVDTAAFDRLGRSFRGDRVHGVAFDRDVLDRARISEADGLAAVTGDDEVNAVVARLASNICWVPRVVARLYDPQKAEIYRRLGVLVVAPVDWSIHRTADLLTFAETGSTESIGSGQVELMHVEAPHLLDGRPIGEVTAAGEVLPVAISRAGRTFIPTAGTTIAAGDILHLAVVAASRARLESMLGAR
jgi:trk system potassium uptake protein